MKTEKILTIGDAVYHYSSGYYSQNKWFDNTSIVLSRSEDSSINGIAKPTELVLYSTVDGSMRFLCSGNFTWDDYVVWNHLIYINNRQELLCYDIDTGTTRLVYKNDLYPDDDFHGDMCMPHITNDGSTVCMHVFHRKDPTVFINVDTKTGTAKKIIAKKFSEPFPVSNHGMVCPTDKDLIFFAHEGTTEYISNRLWLAKDGKAWNIARQTLTQDGNLGDCFGHEMWAPDGKGLYFTKYICSPEGPTGICYVDAETGVYKLLYSKFNYWHTAVSPDGNFVLSDTQCGGSFSEVIAVNQKTGEEFFVDKARTNFRHPCHPHPQMSPDSTKIAYTALDDSGRTVTKIAFLSLD